MSFNPLCPPSEPLLLIRIVPKSRFRSSEITSKFLISTFSFLSQYLTALPLRLTKVEGFNKIIDLPLKLNLAT